MSAGIDWLLTKEIQQAIDDGVISEKYDNFNVPSISELMHRIGVLGEIDTYVVIKSLIKNHRELFVNILEYMNKKELEKAREGEKNNGNDTNI